MVFNSDDPNLYIYYKFIEPSGTPIVNYAVNAPTSYEDGNPLDLSLGWYSTPNMQGGRQPGTDGLYRLWVGPETGSVYPPQWGQSDYAASGFTNLSNTTVYGYDVIKSKWIGGSAIGGAIGSGAFTLGLWLCPQSNANLGTSDHFFWSGQGAGTSVSTLSFAISTNASQSKLTVKVGGSSDAINSPLMSGTLGNGMWNHVVLSYDPSASIGGIYFRAYLNGVLVHSEASAGTFAEPYHFSFLHYWDSTTSSTTQAVGAIKDFFLFNKILTDDEVSDIFNNGINDAITFKSNNNNLKLWYRFSEPSGIPIASWATNTPTGLYYDVEKAISLDTDLQWYNNPANGYEGIFSIDASESGNYYPSIWNNNPDRTICVSGNTTNLYHALRSNTIGWSEISHIISSGSFSVSCWYNYNTIYDSFNRFIFAFDRGSIDDLALGLNNYNTSLARFAYNDGVGSNHYLYNTQKNTNIYNWNHVVITHTSNGDGGIYGRFYINGQLGGTTTDPELDSLLPPFYLTFFNNYNEWSDGQHYGAIKDFAIFDKELSNDEIDSLYNKGIVLITTESSGIAGGYIAGRSQTSGVIGGYANGWAYEASGILGGFGYGRWIASGICGGYLFCGSRIYDSLGGFIYASGVASGILGGYTYSVNRVSGILGGYNFSVVRNSGIIGGFINGGLQGSGIIDSSFRIKAITYSDFDALAHIYAQGNSDFDAQVSVFRAERSPFVSIKYPDGLGLAEGHDVSGVLAPLLIWFVGSGVAVDNKTVDKAVYNFGDLSAQAFGTASGIDEYVTTHNYVNSGIYVATLKVTDTDGMIGSDYVRINLASGVPMPNVSLTASPTIGYAPLSVDFDYSVTNIPAGVTIVSKVLLFGNGQSSINPDITYTYTEPGQFIPILIVKDSRGFYSSDSIEIGVNN